MKKTLYLWLRFNIHLLWKLLIWNPIRSNVGSIGIVIFASYQMVEPLDWLDDCFELNFDGESTFEGEVEVWAIMENSANRFKTIIDNNDGTS